MKRTILILATLGLTMCAVEQATASVLFYGGDWYGNGTGSGTTTNQNHGGLQANVYQNFIVPVGQQWTISGLFGNNLVDPPPTNGFTGADWSIRSGVSTGNGGTVIASGNNSPVTITPTGRGFAGFLEETFSVDVPSVTLNPGTYWMNVTPAANDGTTYNTWTLGTNAVGSHHVDDNFIFVSINGIGVTQNFLDIGGPFSDGVLGSSGPASAVPEPATLTLLGIGIAGIAGFGWRRRKQVVTA